LLNKKKTKGVKAIVVRKRKKKRARDVIKFAASPAIMRVLGLWELGSGVNSIS
jgi:hypothetical protein